MDLSNKLCSISSLLILNSLAYKCHKDCQIVEIRYASSDRRGVPIFGNFDFYRIKKEKNQFRKAVREQQVSLSLSLSLFLVGRRFLVGAVNDVFASTSRYRCNSSFLPRLWTRAFYFAYNYRYSTIRAATWPTVGGLTGRALGYIDNNDNRH